MHKFLNVLIAALICSPFGAQSNEQEDAFEQFSKKQIECTSPDGLIVQIPTWTPSWHHGLLNQLNAVGEEALGIIPDDITAEEFVTSFLAQTAQFWGLSESTSLKLQNIEELTSPHGHHVQVLHLDQYFDGQLVFDGSFQAIVWDHRLVQIAGQAFVPSDKYVNDTLFNTDAAIKAVQALGETQSLISTNKGLSAEWGHAVEEIQGYLVNPEDEQPQSYRFFVDPNSLEILWADLQERNYPSYTGTYRIYKPSSSSITPNASIPTDVTNGYVSINGSQVYPWQDVLTDRSPVPVYDDTISWTSCQGNSPCLGFNWNSNSIATFLNSPSASSTGDNFRSQHASYWAQRAVRAGDINFNWWPPSNSNYKYSRISIITNEGSSSDLTTGNNGCWNKVLWRPSDGAVNANPRIPCIKFPADSNYRYGTGQAVKLNGIFHEVGHAIDVKYKSGVFRGSSISGSCDPNTSEEASSLSETIASLYSIMMMFHEFGASTSFTNSSITNLTEMIGSGTLLAHTNDSNVRCHADPNLDCYTNKYEYGHGLLQAYFEITHGINCDGPVGESCYVMPDTARVDEARWALFYAMKNTPTNGTYRAFVSNLLNYYYYDVGEAPWNDRWWVLNHHGLVGPNYTYTPCSED